MTSESALKFPLRLDGNTVCHLRVGGLPVSVIGKHLVVFHEYPPLEYEVRRALDGRSTVLRLATAEDLVRIERLRADTAEFQLREQERDQEQRAEKEAWEHRRAVGIRISRKMERARVRPMQVRLAQVADPGLKKAMKDLWLASREDYDMELDTGEAIDRILEVLLRRPPRS